jgi:hypothetical protein
MAVQYDGKYMGQGKDSQEMSVILVVWVVIIWKETIGETKM